MGGWIASGIADPLHEACAVLHNQEAERALLGAMLLSNDKIPEIIERIPPRAREFFHVTGGNGARRRRGAELDEPLFSHVPNQEIFEVIYMLYDRAEGVDLTTLGHELDRLGRYEAVGGVGYLASLEDEFTSDVYLPGYVKIVVDSWRLRTLDKASDAIKKDVASGRDDVESLINEAERRIFEISQDAETKDFRHVGEIAADDMMEIEARFKNEIDSLPALPTGFKDLDRVLVGGLRRSNLILLAARPSVGKSAFAMNIAAEVAVRRNRPVGMFSLEMSDRELTQRLLCTLGHVPLSEVRGDRISADSLNILHEQTRRLNTAPLYIDDSADLTVLAMRSRARRLKALCPDLALLIIDYLQLMRATGSRYDNRQQEVSEISRALKSLSRELDVPVLALSQLSRDFEKRQGRGMKDKMPRLSDLRESGSLEQDADVVILIHREFGSKGEGDPASRGQPDLAWIRVAKQRNGPTGDVEMLFRGHITEFANIDLSARGPQGTPSRADSVPF